MNGSSGEGGGGEHGSGSGASALSNGLVNGHVPFTMKRRKHISNERQRRVHMNNLLESLHGLLPDPNPRKDRCSLLTDVTDYLRSLQDKAHKLATHKEAIITSLAQAKKFVKPNKVATLATSSHLQNVRVQVLKAPKLAADFEEIIITFTSLKTKGFFSEILKLLSINQIEIVNATFSTTPNDQMLHYIHAQVPKDLNLKSDDIKALFSELSQLDADEEHIT